MVRSTRMVHDISTLEKNKYYLKNVSKIRKGIFLRKIAIVELYIKLFLELHHSEVKYTFTLFIIWDK